MKTRSPSSPACLHALSVLGVVACLVFAGGAAVAQAPKLPKPAAANAQVDAPALKVSPAGRTALAAAKAVRAEAKGLRDAERAAVLNRAITAYSAVFQSCVDDKAACGRAAFELGGLHRRVDAFEAADAAYKQAIQFDPKRFQQRALFEIAHLQRRQKSWQEAVTTYREVASMDAQSKRSHTARVWVARMLEKLDDTGSLDAFRSAAESATGPRQVLDACNWLAKALVASGDLAGAAAAIQTAERSVAGVSEQDAKLKASLQKALGKMSARRALQRAEDKVNQAARDAQDIENQGTTKRNS